VNDAATFSDDDLRSLTPGGAAPLLPEAAAVTPDAAAAFVVGGAAGCCFQTRRSTSTARWYHRDFLDDDSPPPDDLAPPSFLHARRCHVSRYKILVASGGDDHGGRAARAGNVPWLLRVLCHFLHQEGVEKHLRAAADQWALGSETGARIGLRGDVRSRQDVTTFPRPCGEVK
jgi:hypothetical protein